MLTVKIWKIFWFRYLLESLVFLIPFFLVSLLFSSHFSYMGENTSSIFFIIIKSQPNLVLISLFKILFVTLVICLGLQFVSSSFSIKYKLFFGFIFFFSAIIRVCSLYPGVSENWLITQNLNFFRDFIQFISTLKEDSKRRALLEWLPFIVSFFAFFINLMIHMRYLTKQSRIVKKARSSINIDELDNESRIFSIQGMSFLIFFIFGTVFLYNISSSFRIDLPKNSTKQARPHVFIFAIDSLRYDRLADENFSHVMPFLKSKLPKAALFKPMLVGIPRTFPSWVEIATGTYASKTGVRSMFPPRSTKIEKKETIFSAAKDSGYSTIFVSDFAGDIFPRYPFGATEVNAPTSNLEALVENGILAALSPIQAILTLPNMQRVLPSLLETPEIADPRLVANTISRSLNRVANVSKPVFLTTFFSSAHFPYASPGPWYAKFQNQIHNNHLIFRKTPDQNVIGDNIKLNISDEVKTQTIALYDGGLNAIDHTLKTLYEQLQVKGWLNNSVILIFGDHGENLYEGQLGMGHGDGVAGEFSNVTPLVIFLNGNAQTVLQDNDVKQIVRSIDIAPTIARRINVNLNEESLDGEPLLDTKEKIPDFPSDSAYMETGIWFTSGNQTPEHFPRIMYPGVTALLDIDAGMNFEFIVRPTYSQAIPGVKERAWVNETYRLIARTTPIGVNLSLYLRTDHSAKNNLIEDSLESNKYKIIALEMLNHMNKYLTSRGVEIVPNGNGSFFYAENISQ
ncbi:sulfatase-like hydrolase/transferase [Silvanigrella aquatica]|uniref:Sulfatase N-terminal domain-containing protein n=1 Tax=Silvanigrella aquatica TaxID=1915309 RepID=A0A1L4CXF7_9BACT|nr:sulfatase-like hydrolase/transferase [Silvanigrella aquatica]APJ02626.1 hypothetical protein AXG55_01230 [Silvanigrella aquatica]